MWTQIGRRLVAWAERWVPDPFVFAVGLTLVALFLGILLTGTSPAGMVAHWNHGFWNLLEFSMQMSLILVTGHALAASRPIHSLLIRLADLPRSRRGAVALVCLAAMLAGLLNWGLGLILGALLAREVGVAASRKGLKVHYPLLGAAGYTGMMVWHGGLSGSAPLNVATPGHFLEERIGLLPVTDTIFSFNNLGITLALLALTPLVLGAMHPREEEEIHPVGDYVEADEAPPPPPPDPTTATPASKLEDSRVLAWVTAGMGLAWSVWSLAGPALHGEGMARVMAGIDLNSINFFFLFLGLAFHGSLRAYTAAVGEATTGAAGIVLQFPFYAGIMGMVGGSGLITLASNWMTGCADLVMQTTGLQVFPLLAFLSAGLVNLFVPSGGGQWAIQGPIAVEAALQMKLEVGRAVMAVAYGDEWTNMLQPFWALPLLAITRLAARDLIGYTLPLMVVAGLVVGIGLMMP